MGVTDEPMAGERRRRRRSVFEELGDRSDGGGLANPAKKYVRVSALEDAPSVRIADGNVTSLQDGEKDRALASSTTCGVVLSCELALKFVAAGGHEILEGDAGRFAKGSRTRSEYSRLRSSSRSEHAVSAAIAI